MKRVLLAMLMVPIALFIAYGAVNLGTAVISGDLDLLNWVVEHKVILAFVGCYMVLQFVGPFKKLG